MADGSPPLPKQLSTLLVGSDGESRLRAALRTLVATDLSTTIVQMSARPEWLLPNGGDAS